MLMISIAYLLIKFVLMKGCYPIILIYIYIYIIYTYIDMAYTAVDLVFFSFVYQLCKGSRLLGLLLYNGVFLRAAVLLFSVVYDSSTCRPVIW